VFMFVECVLVCQWPVVEVPVDFLIFVFEALSHNRLLPTERNDLSAL
jgi:hypothetical protein